MASPALEQFHPIVAEWFSKTIGIPSPPQEMGWPVIAENRHVLIAAPTGSGKTLSAFMEGINRLFEMGIEGKPPKGVYLLYVSPLKALNNDIHRNLDVPLDGIRKLCHEKGVPFPQITKAVRTGDTSQRDRAAMLKNPPHILITTPESLYLMLTSRKSAEMLKNIHTLIIDEIHSLFGTKRGAHLSVSIERLQAIVHFPFNRIGLSATVNPLESAALFLGGLEERDAPVEHEERERLDEGEQREQREQREEREEWEERKRLDDRQEGDTREKRDSRMRPRSVEIVAPQMSHFKDLRIVLPVTDFGSLEGNTVWPHVYDTIDRLIKERRNTIVFVNNRTTAEKIAANLNTMNDEEIIRPHHGSMSRESRHSTENLFKDGELKSLVATATLELGIDIGGVDQMIQIAPPVSVSSGIQRLGRAGHRPGDVSFGCIIPRMRNDLLLAAFMAEEMLAGNLERQEIPENCLDVLAQHIVSMACLEEIHVDEIYRQVRSAWAYRNLSRREFDSVLKMLTGDFEHREDIPVSPRIRWDRQSGFVSGTTYSRMLAVGSGGTIPDRGYYPVHIEAGKTRVGELDEVFVFEARIGDRFMLGNTAWKIEKIESQRVLVSKTRSAGARAPFWQGDGIGWDYATSRSFCAFLKRLEGLIIEGRFDIKSLNPYNTGANNTSGTNVTNAIIDEHGVANLREYLEDQLKRTGCLPNENRIIVEYLEKDGDGRKTILHMPFGARVNRAIAIVLQHALEQALKAHAYVNANDMTIVVHLYGDFDEISNPLSLLHANTAEDLLIRQLPRSARFAIAFRYNAYRGMIMGARSIGKRLPLWIQRLRSVDALETASKYKDHPIIIETYRDCLLRDLDVSGMVDVLKRIQKGDIEVIERNTLVASPFARDILNAFKGVMMYEEKEPFPTSIDGSLISSKDSLLTAINSRDKKSDLGWHPMAEKEILEREASLSRIDGIKSTVELADFLRMYGDLSEGDINNASRSGIRELLNEMHRHGSTAVMEFPDGNRIWFPAEEMDSYVSAFAAGAVDYPRQIHDKGDYGDYGDDSGEVGGKTGEEARLRIFSRFIRYASPISADTLSQRYSLPTDEAEYQLDDMAFAGLLKAVSQDGMRLYYHHKVFERIDRRSLSMKSQDVEPETLSRFACFLPQYQKVGLAPGYEPEETLYTIIRQLQGLYLPAGYWENIIFPARLKGYSPAWLDKLCASGRIFWRVARGPSPSTTAATAETITDAVMSIAWFCWEDRRMKTEISDEIPSDLTEGERLVMEVLRRRGASFAHVLTSMTGISATAVFHILKGLVARGLVVNDSFASIRLWEAQAAGSKSRAGRTDRIAEKWAGAASRHETGRWGLADPLVDISVEQASELLISRYGLLCRDVFQAEGIGPLWEQALELMKLKEYTGVLLRGYFVEGLSGIQYMRPQTVKPFQTAAGFSVINACDPAMVYGRLLSAQISGMAWMSIPGTALVMKDGEVLSVLERYGEKITISNRANTEDDAAKALDALIAAFKEKRIWSGKKRLHVQEIITEIIPYAITEDILLSKSFVKEVKGYSFWRGI